ncbi:MAG: hypothetical protein C5B49_00560 [Bdellovibrio sp.]|nr:MAG: hypothetical protein C5B49_00560 [Bdellovibrio sp.]
MENEELIWKRCSRCKKAIEFGAKYFVCSVSTCNGLRTGYVFCSVHCFESHSPGARHRDAGAIEKFAPLNRASSSSSGGGAGGGITGGVAADASASTPTRRIAIQASSTSSTASAITSAPSQEVLVIASRLKDYIQARAGYNTSASVMDLLSNYLRILCDRAIDEARADGRKTVMDRDFAFLRERLR